METNTNPKEEKPKTMAKNGYQNIEEQIQKMRLTFSNAKLPHIVSQLQNVGYDEQKINDLLDKLSDLERLHQSQKKDYAKQYAETERMNQKRKEIQDLYMRHLGFCKILFKGDVEATRVLELTGIRKTGYGSWYQQVSNFYGQILSNPLLKSRVENINIKEDAINAQKNALLVLSQIKENQAKEMGEAQKSTEARDKALESLHKQYLELVAYAKILFSGDQTLEQLGIVVKR